MITNSCHNFNRCWSWRNGMWCAYGKPEKIILSKQYLDLLKLYFVNCEQYKMSKVCVFKIMNTFWMQR